MGDLLKLNGRTVLITGAGQGVGRQTALHCGAHGANVIVNDFRVERAEAVAAEVEAAGAMALPVQCDVTDFEAVNAMVTTGTEKFGGIDVLVNNAGNAGPVHGPFEDSTPFWETGPEDWDRWMGTNFYGVLNCTRATLPQMIERKDGRVVSVISDAGRVGEPNLVVYSGAKAGAAGFSRGLAKAVGRYAITVNCVALSGVRTPSVSEVVDDEENQKRMLKSYVIRRVGEPEDAANMILFLASGAASWITGQTYPVNGGYAFSS